MPSSLQLGGLELTADHLKQKLEEFQEKKRKTFQISSVHMKSRSFSKEYEQHSQLEKADNLASKHEKPRLQPATKRLAELKVPEVGLPGAFSDEQRYKQNFLEATGGTICISIQIQQDEVPTGLSVGTSLEDAVAVADSRCQVRLPKTFDASLETATLCFFDEDGDRVAEMQVSTLDGDYRVHTLTINSQLTVLAETSRL